MQMFLVHFEQLSPRSCTASKTYLRFQKMVFSGDGCSRMVSFQSGTLSLSPSRQEGTWFECASWCCVPRQDTSPILWSRITDCLFSLCLLSPKWFYTASNANQASTRFIPWIPTRSATNDYVWNQLNGWLIFTINWSIVWPWKVQAFNHMMLKWRYKKAYP